MSGTAVGSFVGILPGLGAAIASFASYGLAQRLSKDPESFGQGNIEGVAAAESADNAVIPSSLTRFWPWAFPAASSQPFLLPGLRCTGSFRAPW
ncbi:MAG: tripartite tricarboxylate transporter permease [Rhodobacteraceae bacterium]|nr:tripartite tricarboxylate transporter permease [Paracoccaceae bacterium]